MRPWIRLCTLFSGGRPADHLAHRTVAHRLHTGLRTLIGCRLKLSSHHHCKEIDGASQELGAVGGTLNRLPASRECAAAHALHKS
jgi:hypothetical protein